MKDARPRPRLPYSLAAAVSILGVAAILGASPGAAAPSARPSLDPSLKVHPLLQYGAQAEPDKKVRVLVSTDKDKFHDAEGTVPGARELEKFRLVPTKVMEVPQKAVLELANNKHVRYISPDIRFRKTGIDVEDLKTTYEQAVGIDKVWNGNNSSLGGGVAVATLDSGIDPKHPAIGKTGKVVCLSVNRDAQTCTDQHGHGTHVGGIIAGYDPDGAYVGVAPDARLISVKIADETGTASESDLIRGLQWVFENRHVYNIRVVNLSISAATPESYRTSPLSAAVEQLWFNGVVVVSAAGNRGTDTDAMWYGPGNDPFVITVGALDHAETVGAADDRVASFSSRGRTQDGVAKPDVLAPGRRIVAPLAANSELGRTYPERIVDKKYVRMTGTSMAAPIVSGVVALLLDRFPSLTPNQVKWLVSSTANVVPGNVGAAGAVDAAEILVRAGLGNLSSANLGLVPNVQLTTPNGPVSPTASYWDASYWDASYWDASYWDASYWDASYWDASYWDSAAALD